VQYDQAAILTSLGAELTYMYSAHPASFSHITGVAVWQLGNDYAPRLYGDNFAVNGAFSTRIFGAVAPPAGPSIQLQLTNNGSSSSITTLVTAGGGGGLLPPPAPATNSTIRSRP